MTVFRDGRAVIDDPWIHAAPDAPLPAGAVVVDKPRFLEAQEELLARPSPLGLELRPGEDLDGIEPALGRLALIVLRFPRFADGRPYSIARTLRDVHGFAGELRAAGDVLRDQLGFMLRAGFDSLDVQDPATIAALRDGRVVAVRRHYQPASRRGTEAVPAGPSWRRLAPPASIG